MAGFPYGGSRAERLREKKEKVIVVEAKTTARRICNFSEQRSVGSQDAPVE
jgi:hypothetical protein